MTVSARIVLLTVTAMSLCQLAHGRDIFTVDTNSGVDNYSAGFDNIESAVDTLTQAQLEASLPSYSDPESTADSQLDYRCLPVELRFATSNSTTLSLDIPSLNISENFTGATRSDSRDLLKDYFKGKGNSSARSTINDMQKALVECSSIDPIAGNPNSLQAVMNRDGYELGLDLDMHDYNRHARGRSDSASKTESSSANVYPSHIFNVDYGHGQYDHNGFDVQTDTVTFDYQYRLAADERMRFKLRTPVTVTQTESAETISGHTNASFSLPINNYWMLTPSASYGVTGSDDLGGGAAMTGYSLVSSLSFMWSDILWNMGNMIGKYDTREVSIGDYEVDPGLSNTGYRNGLSGLSKMEVFGLPALLQFFAIDSRFSGDSLYSEHYREFGFALGLRGSEDLQQDDSGKIGITYTDSVDADIDGWKINFGYRF